MRGLMHGITDFAPIEVATTIGVALFALSWFWRGSLVPAADAAPRRRLVAWLGLGGAAAVFAAGLTMSILAWRDPFFRWSEGWWRAAPVIVAALALAALWIAIAKSRDNNAQQGEWAPQPRRSWRAYLSAAPLSLVTSTATLIIATTGWLMLAGKTPPADADLYGFTAPDSALPLYMELSQGYGYIGGAGWPHHLALFVATIVALLVWVGALRADANHRNIADTTALGGRNTRVVVARIATVMLIGALAMSLGALWARIGFIGEFSLTTDTVENADGTFMVTGQISTSYASFAGAMHYFGFLLQGAGAALLMRLFVDSLRALTAGHSERDKSPQRGTNTPEVAATEAEQAQ